MPGKENLSSFFKDENTVESSNGFDASNKKVSTDFEVGHESQLETVEVERKFVSLEGLSTREIGGESGTFASGINEVNIEYPAQEPDPAMKDSFLSDLVSDIKKTVDLSPAVEDSSNIICSGLGGIRSGPSPEPL